ncbi:elongation factor 4 [Candidatus Nomurabacteria bacterium]|nr:elongation factor 4 [Candidatus Nomurabacteria bacterium]
MSTQRITQEKIRNFSIIAHIDHGKSTLADRILEITHNFKLEKGKKERILDRLELEQEKGITIKLQAARMEWKGHELNLIDTPGHVDFSYEVSRSLAACEGVLLLVDAQQGIQAQTISNTKKALDLGLKIIPVINKIDLPNINLEQRKEELHQLLGFDKKEICLVSGKTGAGIEELLNTIIDRCPPPSGDSSAQLKALIFDSYYDEHRGVIVAVRLVDGKIGREGESYGSSHTLQQLFMIQKQESFTPTEIGTFEPDLKPIPILSAGEVGYIATGMKDIRYFTVGDTVSDKEDTPPLPGYKTPKPNVFATFFPTEPDGYEALKIGLNKLAMNDAALVFTEQRSNLLGSGFRCGFLGLLHMEIVQERLEREHDVSLIITAPTVEYKIIKTNKEKLTIQTPQEMPDPSEIEEVLEPWVRVELFCPKMYIGSMMELFQSRRGQYVDTKYLSESTTLHENMQYINLLYDMPLASLISNFFDQMKNLSSGYASMEYTMIDFFPVDLVKVAVLVNKEEIPSLSFLETNADARSRAIKLLKIMKDAIPRQQFQVPIQAAIGAKIIAREDIRGFRKDVTAKLYGGDYSRKKKLLEKQKKGKKRLKEIGKVTIPQEAFLAILKT